MKPVLIPLLTKATALHNHKLDVQFIDSISGINDLSAWNGNGVFQYWHKEENCSNFKIDEFGKMVWNDEIDMDSDAWYLQLTNKIVEQTI